MRSLGYPLFQRPFYFRDVRFSVVLSVALYNIRSLYNVGSVFRTSSGAGFDHIYLAGYTGAPPHPRLSKVALGTEDEVPFSRYKDLDALLTELADHYVVVLEQRPDSELYREIELPSNGKPVTVVLGEELFGTPDQLIERADTLAEIPMAGKKQSLNVASAFAVVAYEFAFKAGRLGREQLKSRQPKNPPRPGVLTKGSS